MNRRNIAFIIAAALLCGILAYYSSRRSFTQTRTPVRGPAPLAVAFMVFNTQAAITIHAPTGQPAEEAARAIMDAMTNLHNTINAYDTGSELSKLNQSAADAPFHCSDLLWDIILKARQAYDLSEHRFDATVGPLLSLWGFHAKRDQLPQQQDIDAARQKVGFDKIRLDHDRHTVAFTVPGMHLDFGGIAKGYALSIAIDIARQHQITSFMLDFGGNIYCSEVLAPEKDTVSIGIKNPRQTDTVVTTVALRNQCIATSGNYERHRVIQGKTIGHIMDPLTGYPVTPEHHYESVTAITKDPTLSDVFSTTAFVGGPALAEKLVRAYPGTAFVYVSFADNGSPVITHVPAPSSQP